MKQRREGRDIPIGTVALFRKRRGLRYWVMELRPAEPADAMEVARLHVRTWQEAYRGIIPDEYLGRLRAEDRAARYDFAAGGPRKLFTMLAVESGKVAGFATTGPSGQADLPEHGELYALYVGPEWWGSGIGAALMLSARGRLRKLGFRSAALWVFAANERARRFYEIDGWAVDGVQKTDPRFGADLEEVRYQRVLD